MNKKLTTIISIVGFSLFCRPAFAGATAACSDGTRIFLIEGKAKTLCWQKDFEAWLSPECFSNSKNQCGALKIVNSASSKNTDLNKNNLDGGKNPGSVLCAQLGGAVMIATLPTGSQVTFCEAKDSTDIDCNALANQFNSSK